MALSEWSEIQADGFEIFYQPGMEKFAKMIQSKAPQAKRYMENQLNQSFDQPIRMVISGSAEFSKIQPNSPPEWASATAYPEKNLIFLKPLARAGIEDINQTFLHELAHLFIHHRLKGESAPKWFEEGLAILFSGEFSYERFQTLARIGISGQYLRFRDLDQGFPFNTNLAQLAYLQSEDLVSFLMDLLGAEKFNQLLDRIATGENFYDALQNLSGLSFSDLEKKWQHRVKYRYGLALALGGSTSLWFLITILFLIAYLKKVRQARQKAMELESGYNMDAQDEEDDEETDDEPYWH